MKTRIWMTVLIACAMVAPAIGQSLEWRYHGGSGDGSAMRELSLSDMNGTSLASRYKGGNHDGYSMLNQNADLAGNDWTLKYLGGNYDGYAIFGTGFIDLVGNSLAVHYSGGSYDGFAMRASGFLDLSGGALAMHYTGGSYDGYAFLESDPLDLKGMALAGHYHGGNHDGFAMLASGYLDLSGASLAGHYHGGNSDGFAMLASDPLDLTGGSLLAHFTGGSFDGYAMVASEVLDLAGIPLANRYRGGSYDGFAAADYRPPPGIPAKFAVKAFLQGPFSGTTMATSLNTSHYLPLSHPYGGPPWYYVGTESVGSIPSSSIVDWVLLETRPDTAMTMVLEQHPAFIKSDGSIVALDGVSPVEFAYSGTGSYYLVVRHRNHLPVMSASPIFTGPLGPGTFDFTTAMTAAYGTNPMKEIVSGTYGLWAGDVTANGQVRYNGAGNDRVPIFSRIGTLTGTVNGYYPEDVNMNGQVRYNGSGNDRTIIFNVTGTLTGTRSSQVP